MPMSHEKMAEMTKLAEHVMGPVLTVAARRLVQSIEEVHLSHLAPLRALIDEAVEHVRHAPGCPSLTKGGDEHCTCGAVDFLSRLEAARP